MDHMVDHQGTNKDLKLIWFNFLEHLNKAYGGFAS
jgi:hypothetical protein